MKIAHDEKVATQRHHLFRPLDGSDIRRRRLVIVSSDDLAQTCGEARLVGFTDASEKHKMYRLRIKVDYASTKRMLPHLFVLNNNTFILYEQWKQRQEEEHYSSQ